MFNIAIGFHTCVHLSKLKKKIVEICAHNIISKEKANHGTVFKATHIEILQVYS